MQQYRTDYPVYGIDLGTSNSCISLYMNGRVTPVQIDTVQPITVPSCIVYKSAAPGDYECGSAAKQLLEQYPTSLITYNKRIKGQLYSDCKAFIDLMRYPFQIDADRDGYPVYHLVVGNQTFDKTPVEVDIDFMTWMIRQAERKTGIPCENIVVTYPAYFNDRQKEATIIAASHIPRDQTGQSYVRLLNLLPEPVAAAIATNSQPSLETRHMVVYDFGGGTFDVAIMKNQLTTYTTKQSHGDANLGGCDIDNLLLQDVYNYIMNVYNDNSMFQNPRNLMKLRDNCERAKIELTSRVDAEIDLSFLGIDDPFVLTRNRFEMIIGGLIERSFQCCDEALQSIGIQLGPNDSFILVGGSSRIPCIRDKLASRYRVNIFNNVNPDNIVSVGATQLGVDVYCQEHNIPSPFHYAIHLLVLRDVGVRIDKEKGDVMLVLKKGTQANIKKTVSLNNSFTRSKVFVYCRDNVQSGWKHMGFFAVGGMSHKEITLWMDTYGILNYSYKSVFSNNEKTGQINTQSDISDQDAETMQRRRLLANECIKKLEGFKQSFLNHPKREQFNSIVDTAIENFFKTNMVFDIQEQEICSYMQEVCKYIISLWNIYPCLL